MRNENSCRWRNWSRKLTIVRALNLRGDVIAKFNTNVDFLNRTETIDFSASSAPDVVIDAAAKVGGIGANNAFPVEFLMNNVRIQSNLMEAAHCCSDVEKFVFLGSSCIYPTRLCSTDQGRAFADWSP
jgi:GDP-L-fucose synthase